MPSRAAFAPSRDQELGRAGGATLEKISEDVRSDRHFRYRVQRDETNDAYRAERDRVEDRRAEAADEPRRYHFEREKALNTNEDALRKELVAQSTEANQALRDIRTDDPKAEERLADWRVKYYRVLDPKHGDPRLIRQFDINQRFVDRLRFERFRSEETKRRAGGPAVASDPAARLWHLESLRMRKGLTDEERTYLDEELTKARAERDARAKAALAPAGAEAAPVVDEDQSAREWLKANPDDPRAAAIKERLGIK